MKKLFTVCLLIQSFSLFAQQQEAKDNIADKAQGQIKSIQQNSADSAIIEKTKTIGKDLKSDANKVKNSAKELPNKIKLDTIPKPDLKKTVKSGGEILEKKATNLQYNSDNPEDAPWKKKQFSKEDLKDLDLQALPKGPGMPSINDDKVKEYKDKIEDLKPSSIDEKKIKDEVSKAANSEELEKAKQTAGEIENLRSSPLNEQKIKDEISKADKSKKLEKVQHVADSLIAMKDRLETSSLEQELMGAKKIYSEKYIKKICDSLGIDEGNKFFKMASDMAKKEMPKEELLEKINTPLREQANEKAGKEGISFDDKTQSLKMADAEKLNGLPDEFEKMKAKELSELDLASFKLPEDVLSELGPLTGKLMDSKYMHYIDSMRDIAMKAKGYSLDEKQITEEVKRTILKDKPSFLDKSYLECILGFVNDSTISIVQVSPSWGYHFTDNLSVGLGPNISIEYQQKKINALAGFRSFAKAEFWKQRVYAQLEDNFAPSKINKEVFNVKTNHSILLGGGGLLPLSKKLAINLSIFYRVNQQDVRPGGSPWVFRIGLSSVKKISQD